MIRLGISACLMGHAVRYDGGHQLDRFLRDVLGCFVEWVPVCPEVECGLPVPREAMRLVDHGGTVRLVTRVTGVDHTGRMLEWASKRLDELERMDLCGFVFKSKSPSSGMVGVKVYHPGGGGAPRKNGIGLFAGAFMRRFPMMPVEDDGRLNDPALRENFIERIFVYGRWRKIVHPNPTAAKWMDFHTAHKLLLMAHSPKTLVVLGRMVASAKTASLEEGMEQYLSQLMTALKLPATVKKNVNVLQHIMGYFKKQLTHDEKQELHQVIENYHRGWIPLLVPVILLNHYVRKFSQPYLKNQWYLYPHPDELKLRNHA